MSELKIANKYFLAREDPCSSGEKVLKFGYSEPRKNSGKKPEVLISKCETAGKLDVRCEI